MLSRNHIVGWALALAGVGTVAAQPTPPRWVLALEESVAAPPSGGWTQPGSVSSWVRRPDGGGLLALEDGPRVLVHVFDSSGELRAVAELPNPPDDATYVRRWRAAPGAEPWLDLGGQYQRELFRFAHDGSIAARIVSASPGSSTYIAPLADGGVLLSTPRDSMRYDAQGNEVWRTPSLPTSDYVDSQTADGSGASWSSLRRNEGGVESHWLLRRDAAGNETGRFPYPCTTCLSYGRALLALDDGGVLVVTDLESVSRVSDAGAVLWTSAIGARVFDLRPGPAGRATLGLADGHIRTLDLSTGAPGWSEDSTWFFAHASGAVSVVDEGEQRLRVQRLSPAGDILAQATVDLGELGFSHFGAPVAYGSTGIEVVAATYLPTPRGDGCFDNPLVLRIVPGEAPWFGPRVCNIRRATRSLQLAVSATSVLVHDTQGLSAYAWDGRRRWRYTPPSQCRIVGFEVRCPYISHAIGSADGGAWALEGDAEETNISEYEVDRVIRIMPDGSVRRFALPPLPQFSDDFLILLQDGARLRLMWTDVSWNSDGSVRHASFGPDGSVEMFETPVQPYTTPTVEAIRLEDGDFLLRYLDYGLGLCVPLMPCPQPVRILRIDPHGGVRWQVLSPWDHEWNLVSLGRDGSAWLGQRGVSTQLLRVDPEGRIGTVFDSPLSDDGIRTRLLAAEPGHVLHLGPEGGFRLDPLGGVSATTTWPNQSQDTVLVSSRGVLGSRDPGSLVLRSAQTLEPVADFALPVTAGRYLEYMQLASGDDGRHVVLRHWVTTDQRRYSDLVRLDEPGSPAALEFFADGFE